MAWIESHQELGRHPKTKRLARALQTSLPTAVGHLTFFWWWALDYAQNGDLNGFDEADMADAAGWEGEPGVFVNALIAAKFLDQDERGTRIHDWHDYAGRLIGQRRAQAASRQKKYALYSDLRLTRAVKARDGDICQYCGKTVDWSDRRGGEGGTYDRIDPDGGNAIDNIVVCCRLCSSEKGGRTPEQAEMPLVSGKYALGSSSMKARRGSNKADMRRTQADDGQKQSAITVPDPTQPNHTVQNRPPLPPPRGGQGDGGEATNSVQQQRFDEFWEAYPKKTGKDAARKAWKKRKPTAELHTRMLDAVGQQKQSGQWRRDGGQFIPSPSRWLNEGRWDDEPPEGGGQDGGHGPGPDGMPGFRDALAGYRDGGTGG
ncbi:MAG: HNH endonuclease [Clostridiales Family XIII bacterium]|jgi:hypothetical protein|nr:HNH endonuclease [Clostridiales Family XIII bacterium]